MFAEEIVPPLPDALALQQGSDAAALVAGGAAWADGKPAGSAKWDYPVGHANDLVIGKWGGAVSHKGLIDEEAYDRGKAALIEAYTKPE